MSEGVVPIGSAGEPWEGNERHPKFYVGDQVCKLQEDNLLVFGELLERGQDNLFVVEWKVDGGSPNVERGFNPYEDEQVRVINRKLRVGERVVLGSLRSKGTVTKVFTVASLVIPKSNHLVLNASLKNAHPYVDRYLGEPIFYGGWIGEIAGLDWCVALEFDKESTCTTTTTQNPCLMKTLHFPGSEIKERSLPPHRGQSFTKHEIDLDKVKWTATGWTVSLLGYRSLPKEAFVTDVQVSEIDVTWLTALSGSPPPPRILTVDDFQGIVDLDIHKRIWLQMNTVCFYASQKDEIVVNYADAKKVFMQEFYEAYEAGAEEGCPEKRRKRDADQVNIDFNEVSVNVVVHSVRQKAEVVLENGTVQEQFSSEILQRDDFIAENDIQIREFVRNNDFNGISDSPNPTCTFSEFGLVLSKDMEDEIFILRQFTGGSREAHPIPTGPDVEISKYDLVPHHLYGGLKEGRLVTRSPHHPNLNFEIGVIEKITENGQLKIFCGASLKLRPLWPHEVEVFKSSSCPQSFPNLNPRLPIQLRKGSRCRSRALVRTSSTTMSATLARWNAAIQNGVRALSSKAEPAPEPVSSDSESHQVPLEQGPTATVPQDDLNEMEERGAVNIPGNRNYFHDKNTYGIKVSHDIHELKTKAPPAGIAIKCDPIRFDLWTALIQGPAGTPYEDGLFVFDVQLHVDYPHVPPRIHYRSLSSRRISPNLKEDGTVCLSLLGNWPGKAEWNSESSIVEFLIQVRGKVLRVELMI